LTTTEQTTSGSSTTVPITTTADETTVAATTASTVESTSDLTTTEQTTSGSSTTVPITTTADETTVAVTTASTVESTSGLTTTEQTTSESSTTVPVTTTADETTFATTASTVESTSDLTTTEQTTNGSSTTVPITTTPDETTVSATAASTVESTSDLTTTEQTTTLSCATSLDCPADSFCDQRTGNFSCTCVPGSYLLYEDFSFSCQQVFQFGGIFSFRVFISRSFTFTATTFSDRRNFVKEFVFDANQDLFGLLTVEVDEKPSQINDFENWNYKLIFLRTSDVNSSLIEDNLKIFTENNCVGEYCSINGSSTVFVVDTNETLQNFGDNDEFLCKDYPCDDKSTTCVVEQNVRYCVCKPNFLNTLGSAIACQKIICTDNDDCNYPFGVCKNDMTLPLGSCSCIKTFSGEHCENPWMFVFIIITTFIAITTVGIIIVVIFKKKKRKKHSFKVEKATKETPLRAQLPLFAQMQQKSPFEVSDQYRKRSPTRPDNTRHNLPDLP